MRKIAFELLPIIIVQSATKILGADMFRFAVKKNNSNALSSVQKTSTVNQPL
ncbi:MAG: hypothetical protein IJU92_04905 [Spirochaetaceae bacterium]|nr:hypothetical protein [Spirochaetaceae bacterium]